MIACAIAMTDVYLVPKPAQSQPSDISLLIERYRTTRLTALQLDPDAFGSTYAREIQFTDEIWLSRLLNPLSRTLVSVDVKPPLTEPVDLTRHEWLGTATILGPKVLSKTKGSSVWTTYTRDNSNDPPDWPAVKDSNAIYMIAGVFVHPSRRRQGRGKRLIQAVVSAATEEAKRAGASRVTILLEIESENQAPDRLYESAGFWAVDREGTSRRGMVWELNLAVN
jgi:GNAT superfamily N-acetyltransferase